MNRLKCLFVGSMMGLWKTKNPAIGKNMVWAMERLEVLICLNVKYLRGGGFKV